MHVYIYIYTYIHTVVMEVPLLQGRLSREVAQTLRDLEEDLGGSCTDYSTWIERKGERERERKRERGREKKRGRERERGGGLRKPELLLSCSKF